MSIPNLPESALERPPTLGQRLVKAFRRLVPSGSAWIDAAFTVVLMALALYGLRTVFFGPLWIMAAAVGVIVGVVFTHIMTSWRAPAILTLLLLAFIYFFISGPNVIRHELALGFLPTGGTLGALFHQLIGGWKEFLTSLTPLDAEGPVLALPHIVGLVGAALTYGAARSWRSAIAPIVPALVTLGVVIALGTTNPASTLLQGAVFSIICLGWASLRSARNRPALQNGAGTWTRAAVALTLLAIALAGGIFIGPRLSGDESAASEARNVWRTGLVPPYDIQQFPSPLAGFRKYTEPNQAKLFDKHLLTVNGTPAGMPVRLATLDSYDGYVWGAGSTAQLTDGAQGTTFRKVGTQINASGSGDKVTATMLIPPDGYSDVWMPTIGTVTRLDFAGGRPNELREQLRFNTDTNTGVIPGGLRPGDQVTVTAYPPLVPQDPAKLPESLEVNSGGGLVDHPSMAVFDAKIDQWAGKEPDQWKRIAKIASSLRAGAYTDGGKAGSRERFFLPGHGTKRMNEFVKLKQLAGNDEQYASAFALMVNRMGTPARVVLGVVPERDGTVKGKDVHAWVEVQLADGEWQTIPYQAFLPDRNRLPDEVKPETKQQLRGAQVPPPAANNPPSVLQGPEQAQTTANNKDKQAEKEDNVLDPSTWPDWLRYVFFFVILPILVLLLIYSLIRLAKLLRRRRRRRNGELPQRVSGGWREILDTARDLRMPVQEVATRREQATGLASLAPGALLTLPPMADRADAHVFAPGSPTEAEIEDYWADVATARKAMRQQATGWQRLKGDVSLRTFSKKYRDPEAIRRKQNRKKGRGGDAAAGDGAGSRRTRRGRR